MMYLSKGLPVEGKSGTEFQVSHCGRIFALGPEMAELWSAARLSPRESPAGKERFVQRMEQSGLITSTDEHGKLAHYRLLASCIICPEQELSGHTVRPGRDGRVWTWIEKAGLRLTASELIRLEERHIKPVPELLGEDGRQRLTEQIYTRDTIGDGFLDALMEHSPARDALVASLLRLLRAGRLFLV